jgi:hypothetical protein
VQVPLRTGAPPPSLTPPAGQGAVPFAPWALSKGKEAIPSTSAASRSCVLPVPRQCAVASSQQQQHQPLAGPGSNRPWLIQRMSSAPLVRHPPHDPWTTGQTSTTSDHSNGSSHGARPSVGAALARSNPVCPAPPNSLVNSFAEEVNTPELGRLWMHAKSSCKVQESSTGGSSTAGAGSDECVRL